MFVPYLISNKLTQCKTVSRSCISCDFYIPHYVITHLNPSLRIILAFLIILALLVILVLFVIPATLMLFKHLLFTSFPRPYLSFLHLPLSFSSYLLVISCHSHPSFPRGNPEHNSISRILIIFLGRDTQK